MILKKLGLSIQPRNKNVKHVGEKAGQKVAEVSGCYKVSTYVNV